MKTVSISWSSGVRDEEAMQSLSAIVSVVTTLYHTCWPWGVVTPIVELHPFGNWTIDVLEPGTPYASFDWYLENSYNSDQTAINGDRFLDLVAEEPWQQQAHHYDFSLVHLPLQRENGESPPILSRSGMATVISVDWVRSIAGVEAQRLALRRLTYYGLGIALGMQLHQDESSFCGLSEFSGRSQLLARAMAEQGSKVIYCDEHLRQLLGILLSGKQPLN